MLKTIVPQQKNRYASFPTFVKWKDNLVLFFRQGEKHSQGVHGTRGSVWSLTIPVGHFLDWFDNRTSALIDEVAPKKIFQEHNEMDAIVSSLSDHAFGLGTRTFGPDGQMKTYFSFSGVPEFTHRQEVKVPGVSWVVLFGKGIFQDGRYLFPAYGGLDKSPSQIRPLILEFKESNTWHLLSTPPIPDPPVILDECSLIWHKGKYHLFLRQDNPPFGIWSTTSLNLKDWAYPEVMIGKAHAPMAGLDPQNRLVLAFRHILGPKSASPAIMFASDTKNLKDLDPFAGNIYDGGYCDLGWIDHRLFIIYYRGNPAGEPCIKVCSHVVL